MRIRLNENYSFNWEVKKIGVIGPGIVGMPMATLLANARIKIGTDGAARVCVVQRNSQNSGWKVEAINSGRSVIGGIEPGLDKITAEVVKEGLLQASWDFNILSDADVVLVSIQTDKDGFGPDYGPLFGGLTNLAEAFQKKPKDKIPLVVFESTLAPSSMTTVIKDHFASFGLIEGKDILLGNSPNRVMPGRLVERVTDSDKLVAGLHPETPRMIKHIYEHIVTNGTLHATNSMTAEVVKTLENAYRDVRIAFSSEVVRYCDDNNLDFYQLRDEINSKLAQADDASGNPNAVPSGGILIPMLGVGGHCLPKDGILLWWRKIESAFDTSNSLILNSRIINDESPAETIRLFERNFEKIDGKRIAVLGAAYRFNSEDTRNSPSIQLALQLVEKGCQVILHDPYVKENDQNLKKFGVDTFFTNNLQQAIDGVDYIVMATAHQKYMEEFDQMIAAAANLKGILDGCNIYKAEQFDGIAVNYAGIGRGREIPSSDFVDFVFDSFKIMERGVGNEVQAVCDFLNMHYADSEFNRVDFKEVQRLAASCSTGCEIANTGKIDSMPNYNGLVFSLVKNAFESYQSSM
ncbi:MAG: nucleotide sugar dehydrogenase [Bacteroidetes bacterium]|nr:nucleotide sugar dehydrogenase [Bacteroidota bacterium]